VLNPRSTLAALLEAPMRPGEVIWIGLRPARHAPLTAVDRAMAQARRGLVGDHYETRTDGRRQVTLIQAEHLAAIASYVGRDGLDPGLLRRNIVVAGINLLALKDKRFRLGEAVLEHTGACHPCSRMEDALGIGGYNAMRGHGGITARVIHGGEIRRGNPVDVAPEESDEPTP
jgi:MOSC domain-containing protein YiiM